MKACLFGQVAKADDLPFILQLIDSLRKRKFEFQLFSAFYESITAHTELTDELTTFGSYEDIKNFSPDLFISLGGDGTILKAMTLVKDLEIPLLGFNLGRLGYLANAEKSKMDMSLDYILNGEYEIEGRSLLALESERPLFEEYPYALNDMTVLKRDNASMILIHCYVDGELLNSYWADGIIISTPTGSTSYSLSVGGPIIAPNCNNFVISAVAPHNLTVRPIVLSDDVELKIKVEGRSDNYLVTLDSRNSTITESDTLYLRKAKHKARFVVFKNNTFIQTLHHKLNWGSDKRNA